MPSVDKKNKLNYLLTILRWGVFPETPRSLISIIPMVNGIAIGGFFWAIAVTSYSLVYNSSFASLQAAVIASSFLLVIVLNYFRFYDLSRLAVPMISIFVIFTMSVQLGLHSGIHMYLFPLVAYAFLVFPAQEIEKRIFCLILPILSYVFFILKTPLIIPQIPGKINPSPVFYHLMVGLAYSGSIAMTYFLTARKSASLNILRRGTKYLQNSLRQARRLERELQQFKTLATLSPNLIILFRTLPQHQIQFMNPAALEFFGLTTTEVAHLRWENLISDETAHDQQLWQRALDSLSAESTSTSIAINLKRKNAPTVPVELTLGYCGKKHQQTVFVIAREIKKAIDQGSDLAIKSAALLNASRLSTLGEMAAEIAHEINGSLMIISMRLELIESQLAREAPTTEFLHKNLGIIQRNTSRIAKTIRGMKDLSRYGDQDPLLEESLHAIIYDVVDICSERMAQKNVKLTVGDIPLHLSINCRVTQIGQVLLNLLHNACDIVVDLPERWISVSVEDHTPGVLSILITDSGTGIPDDIVQRLFTPFFTTKPVGKGTGLGLSLSRAIIHAHGGELHYELRGGHTCFIIRLPRFGESAKSTIEKEKAVT